MTVTLFLLSSSPVIELLPLVECAFALGQKPFRLRAKRKEAVAIAVNSCVSIYYWRLSPLYLSFQCIVIDMKQDGKAYPNQDEAR